MTGGKKILVSGIQPSGTLHIGNYFGAMKRFVELQDEFESFIFVANYHALTSVSDANILAENTRNVILDYLAIGLTPENLFPQSDIPEVTELAWIFNTLITVPYLSRAVAYKEKVEKGLEATVGLFDYPALMAADILIMDADVVPVGQDQKQHVEIARDIAEKFNNRYGETFKLPKAHIMREVATVPGIDGQKMSKSYKNTIPLFATDEEIKKLVMSIVTDSKGEKEKKDVEADTVFALHRLFSETKLAELAERYKNGTIGYKESKEILIKNITSFIGPLRERRNKIARDNKNIFDVIENGRARAQKRARAKMKEVREKVGITF
ncbi:MAG: tryptophan--tRNA ligase [Parcubacteria group bacterium]|nr:tryptophan--tRNA ligase [Parcubacteria group bacterium]